MHHHGELSFIYHRTCFLVSIAVDFARPLKQSYPIIWGKEYLSFVKHGWSFQ